MFTLEEIILLDTTLQHFEEVNRKVTAIVNHMRHEYLAHMARQSPGYFIIAEHIVALRLLTVDKKRHLEKLYAEKMVPDPKEEVFDHLLHHIRKITLTPEQETWVVEFNSTRKPDDLMVGSPRITYGRRRENTNYVHEAKAPRKRR